MYLQHAMRVGTSNIVIVTSHRGRRMGCVGSESVGVGNEIEWIDMFKLVRLQRKNDAL
jgi:hypothetical protein